jgi:putative addiction module component (TIGR02574 family)
MSAAEILEAAKALPQEERIKFAQDVWEIVRADGLSPEQIEEAERRAERLSRNPEGGIPWEQVRAELPERLKNRKCAAK